MRRALLVLLLTAAACGPIDDSGSGTIVPPPVVDGEPVLFLGDSLTVGARSEGGLVDRATEAGIEADVLAQEGKDVGWGVQFTQARPSVPPVVVVELGTNPDADAEPFATEVETLVAVLRSRGATTVAWVTPVHRDDRYDEKIAVLEQAAAEGELVLADWRTVVRENPDWLIRDGLHYTDEGYASLAEFLVATAAALIPAP